MTNIVIGQCDLRIRRAAATAAPWLGDDDHRALARRVQAVVLPMLEELLAPRLEGRDVAREIPLRLDLTLRERDLAGAAPLARPALRSRLLGAVEAALAEVDLETRRADPASPGRRNAPVSASPSASPPPAAHPDADPDPGPDLVRYLGRLFARSTAEAALSPLPERALLDLLERALERLATLPSMLDPADMPASPDPEERTGSAAPRPDRGEIIAAIKELVDASLSSNEAGAEIAKASPALLAARTVARRVVTRAGASTPSTDAFASDSGARRIGSDGKAARPSTALPADVRDRRRSAWASTRPGASDKDLVRIEPGRYFLDHALPFLALAVLDRHGITNALMLDVPDPSLRSTLVGAVALKTLPPDTARGPGAWTAGARRAAALTAGLDITPDGAAFIAAAGRLGDGCTCARAGIAAALLGSLHPRGALPLVVAERHGALFDPGGLYPVATGALEAMVPLLRRVGRTLFLSPSDPAVWSVVEQAGLPAVAAGPALRVEKAVSVAGPGGWQGHASGAVRLSAEHRARLPDDADAALRAVEVWQTLAREATLVAAPVSDARVRVLDELAALLAGFALADIGWQLARRDQASWAESDPLLVRDRFADLSGWLEIDARRVTVALPLGRRFTDLRDAGLLDTVRDPPCRPKRELAFRGG